MTENVLLIGIDAGDFDIIDRLINEGKMERFGSLLDQGYQATLESSVPPWTPTAWTSLTAGKNPGKHGIFDFKTPDGDRLVNATDVTTNQIWDYLTVEGKRSIVVNVPVTHPAPDIDGVLIPGYLAPEVDDFQAQPKGIIDELQAEIGDYRLYADNQYENAYERCSDFINLLQMRRDAITYLCNNYEWAFAMVQFQRTDTVFHELPEQRHIERVYNQVDEFIGDIVDTIDYDTLIIASDHGMGPTGTWDLRLNSWLQQKDYLETSLDGRETGWRKPTSESMEKESPLGKVAAGMSYGGITPQRIQGLLTRVGLADAVERIVPDRWLKQILQAGGEKYDPEMSTAYCPSGPGLGIYCDDRITDELATQLSELTDPDGKRVFEWVSRASNVWNGPQALEGPELLVMPRNMAYYISATISANTFEETTYEYNHQREGLFVATGSDIEKTANRGSHSIHDVAPTVLAALGLPLDVTFDGEAVKQVVGEEIRIERRYESNERDTRSFDEDTVESRLENLGYME